MEYDDDENEDMPTAAVEIPADVNLIMQMAIETKAQIAEQEMETKALKAKLRALCGAILKTLDAMEAQSIKSQGYLFYKERKANVTVPETPEEKQALFDYLRQEGIFNEMVSVNSKTLNSLYKEKAEDAANSGILEFEMPGVGKPTEVYILKMKSAK